MSSTQVTRVFVPVALLLGGLLFASLPSGAGQEKAMPPPPAPDVRTTLTGAERVAIADKLAQDVVLKKRKPEDARGFSYFLYADQLRAVSVAYADFSKFADSNPIKGQPFKAEQFNIGINEDENEYIVVFLPTYVRVKEPEDMGIKHDPITNEKVPLFRKGEEHVRSVGTTYAYRLDKKTYKILSTIVGQ